MGNIIRIAVITLVGALALAACGVAGPLEAPGGTATEQNRPANQPKLHRPFILDGIL